MKTIKILLFLLNVILINGMSQFNDSVAYGQDKKIQIRNNLIFMDGTPFDMWGIRVASATEDRFATDHLLDQLDDYCRYGINSIAVYFMGSRGGSYDPFSVDGREIDREHMGRMEEIIRAANDRRMAVIVGIFYQRVAADKIHLQDWSAVRNAVSTVAGWLYNLPYKNVILNIANEQNSANYDNLPWKDVRDPRRIAELCRLAKTTAPGLIVGAGGYDIENNKKIGTSGTIDILLFDTSKPEENSEYHYNIYKLSLIHI